MHTHETRSIFSCVRYCYYIHIIWSKTKCIWNRPKLAAESDFHLSMGHVQHGPITLPEILIHCATYLWSIVSQCTRVTTLEWNGQKKITFRLQVGTLKINTSYKPTICTCAEPVVLNRSRLASVKAGPIIWWQIVSTLQVDESNARILY